LLKKNENVSLDPIESSFFESYRNFLPNYLEMHQNILKYLKISGVIIKYFTISVDEPTIDTNTLCKKFLNGYSPQISKGGCQKDC
jgi:hypothetical protein